MDEIKKKAKLTALKGANKMAKDAMSSRFKSSKELKKHTADMSKESGIDFQNDSESIVDPTHNGNVIGRHISDEQIDCDPSDSTYNLKELDARLKWLMEQKKKVKGE